MTSGSRMWGELRISTVRGALVSALVASGVVLGSAASGSAAVVAAPGAAVTFGIARAATGTPSPALPKSAGSTPAATVPCQTGSRRCASTDPDVALAWSSAVSTAGCRFRVVLDWGDGSPAQSVTFTGATAKSVWSVPHTYGSSLRARHPYGIQARASVVSDSQARGCNVQSAAVTFGLLCTTHQLSGPAWNARLPGGDRDVSDLNPQFRPRVKAFIAAMTQAGITVQPQSTRRSPQRAYLMHYSYLIARGQLAPDQVPGYESLAGEKGPGICWAHRTATGALDTTGSVAAATSLLGALGVDTSLRTPPALHSRHITGDAIDMRLQWTASAIKIKNAAGRTVTITSKPHDDTNPDLIAVGATYGVHHFYEVTVDRNHWSSDGH